MGVEMIDAYGYVCVSLTIYALDDRMPIRRYLIRVKVWLAVACVDVESGMSRKARWVV